ncbi:hypothetical protein CK203_027347 [Vitis vinifera]|uniref:Reverse transcriptase domain-containing protein n=1 Tax=Vitis vinifera TaxID=29760 RepID=A0A438J9K1_VITVI|nr:hypothetical protein CK203_027347 [Vitis vinifera]
MDVILIANETTDSKVKDNLRGIICKLDIEKAYDHVNWSFILEVLEKMRVKEGCFIDEFLVSERHDARVEVSNLLFANDNLILCDASKENLENPELGLYVVGLPLGASYKSSKVWEGVEERFQKRLVLWKRQYFSKGGRHTLIKSTVSNLSITPCPFLSSLGARLEKI